jgi:hypothetical protein
MSNAKLLPAMLNNRIDINALRQYRHVSPRAQPGASAQDHLFRFSLRSAAISRRRTLIQARHGPDRQAPSTASRRCPQRPRKSGAFSEAFRERIEEAWIVVQRRDGHKGSAGDLHRPSRDNAGRRQAAALIRLCHVGRRRCSGRRPPATEMTLGVIGHVMLKGGSIGFNTTAPGTA